MTEATEQAHTLGSTCKMSVGWFTEKQMAVSCFWISHYVLNTVSDDRMYPISSPQFVPVGATADSSFCKTLGSREGFGSQCFSGHRRVILGIYNITPLRIWGPHSIVPGLFKDLAGECG